MAWAEQLPGGGYRGGFRGPDGRKQYVNNEGVPFERKRDAREAAEEAAARARRGTAISSGRQSGNLTWREWWEHLTEKRYKHRVNQTEERERAAVAALIMPRWGSVRLNQITRGMVQEWIDEDLRPGHEPSYVRVVYSVFSNSITKAVVKELLDASPCVGINLPRIPTKAKTVITLDEVEELCTAEIEGRRGDRRPVLPVEYQRMLRFQFWTGLRPNELCGLHASQLARRSRWLEVSNVYVPPPIGKIRPYPKDLDVRYVPLTAHALEAWDAAVEGRALTGGCGVEHANGRRCSSALVFLSTRGQVVTPRTYSKALAVARRALGLGPRSPYSVRRGFGTHAAEQGVDAFTIAAIYGHAKLDESHGYVQRTEKARAQFVAAMDGPEPLHVVGHEDAAGAPGGAKPVREDTGRLDSRQAGNTA